MDDELRSRYRVARRDFNTPAARRQPAPPRPAATLRQSDRPHPQDELLPEAAAAPQPVRKKRRSKKLMMALILVVAVGGGTAGTFYVKSHHKPAKAAAADIALPQAMISQVNYPVYFPSPEPAGYTYQTGSGVVQSGLVFFKLINGNKMVFFTEQAKPAKPVDLDALPNFQKFSVSAGAAALGSNLAKPAGLVVTGSTIVNVSSTGGTTDDDIKAIFNSLAPVPKSR